MRNRPESNGPPGANTGGLSGTAAPFRQGGADQVNPNVSVNPIF